MPPISIVHDDPFGVIVMSIQNYDKISQASALTSLSTHTFSLSLKSAHSAMLYSFCLSSYHSNLSTFHLSLIPPGTRIRYIVVKSFALTLL